MPDILNPALPAGGGFNLEQLTAIDMAPAFYPLRYCPGGLGTWSGHLPFANDLIRSIRPNVLVELGTHLGESYFGFCQSVAQHGTGTLCYAVDHWRGDEHAGVYDDDVYIEVSAYNERHYGGFSHLLRSSFDDALAHFADESIELLHIDGLHTYEAVSHDFQSWLPKVRAGGLILFHDIAVRHANFGVWRLWADIEREYVETFAFHHSWGLGILRKPGQTGSETSLSSILFKSEMDPAAIRRYYVLQATALKYAAGRSVTATKRDEPTEGKDTLQIFPFGTNGYSEATSYIEGIPVDQERTIAASFTTGLGNGPLRIDICKATGFVRLWRLAILSRTGQILWSADTPKQLIGLRTGGGVVAFPVGAAAVFASLDADPQLFIDDVPEAARSEAVVVEVSLAFSTGCTAFLDEVRRSMEDFEVVREQNRSLEAEIIQLRETAGALAEQLQDGRHELSQIHVQLNASKQELAQASSLHREQQAHMQAELNNALADLAKTKSSLEDLTASHTRDMARLTSVEADARHIREVMMIERGRRIALEQSLSWRITRPLRSIASVFMR